MEKTEHAELKKEVEPILPGIICQKSFDWVIGNISNVHYVNIPPFDQIIISKPMVHNDMFKFLPENVIVLSACNGLICCLNKKPGNPLLPAKETLYICNPTNKQWVSLDCPDYDRIQSTVLAYDPHKHPIDDASTIFSLVTIKSEVNPPYNVTFNVYSSETKSWKKSEDIFKLDDIILQGTYIGGIIYWITDSSDQILTWDVEHELFLMISTPVTPTEFRVPPVACIGDWNGRPHYVMITEIGISVWHLKDVHEPIWKLVFLKLLEEIECDNSRLLNNLEFMKRTGTLLPKKWIDPLNFKDGVVFMKVADHIYSYYIDKNLAVKTILLYELMTTSLHRRPNVFPLSSSLASLNEEMDQ